MLGFHCSELASLVVAHGFSCSTVCGVLVSPSGTESASPALEGGFSTPRSPGKSLEGWSFLLWPSKAPHACTYLSPCLLVSISLFPLSGLFSPFPLQASPSRKVPCHFAGPHPYDIVSSQSIPTFMLPHHSLALTSSCIYMAHTSG